MLGLSVPHHLPMFAQISVIGDAKPIVYRGLELPDLIDCYHQLVAIELKDAWSKIFDLLLNSKGGILFHCSQGKDRADPPRHRGSRTFLRPRQGFPAQVRRTA